MLEVRVFWLADQFDDGTVDLSLVFSEDDAQAHDHPIEVVLEPEELSSAVATIELKSAFYGPIEQNVEPTCFEDPIRIRDNTTGLFLGAIEDYCTPSIFEVRLSIDRLFESDIPAVWNHAGGGGLVVEP